MGLQTLVAAIEYLEFQEAQKLNSQQIPNTKESHVQSFQSGPNLIENTSFFRIPSSFQTQRKSKEDVALKRKLVHNKLEKCRRADMRSQLETLKNLLPSTVSPQPYGRLLTTYSTLKRSIGYIKTLEAEENDLRIEVDRLQKQKLEMEKKLEGLLGRNGCENQFEGANTQMRLSQKEEICNSEKLAEDRKMDHGFPKSPLIGETPEEIGIQSNASPQAGTTDDDKGNLLYSETTENNNISFCYDLWFRNFPLKSEF